MFFFLFFFVVFLFGFLVVLFFGLRKPGSDKFVFSLGAVWFLEGRAVGAAAVVAAAVSAATVSLCIVEITKSRPQWAL